MAPSAPPSIKQSYSAGTCRLDLTLQPSALSQWHPRLIVDQVEFELWMSEAQNVKPTLLAAGDRTTLQAIAHHIEHRTQSLLTMGRLNNPPSSNRTPSTIPQLPEEATLPHPLSYLQLCDLSTVFTQCEQVIKPLPSALSAASETTCPVAARNPETTPPQTPLTAVPNRKGRLIFFPTGRRAVWASSAAAALFAVGLTTTLWNRTSVSETPSIANADLAEPNAAASGNERLRLKRPDDERTAVLPNRSSASELERSRVQTAQRPNSASQTTRPANGQRQESSPPASSPPASSPPISSPSTNSSTDNPSAKASASDSAPSAPARQPSAPANSSVAGGSAPAEANSNANGSESADANIAAAPTPASRQAPDNALDRQIASAEPAAESPSPAALSTQTAEAGLPTLEPSREPSTQASARRASASPGQIATQESATVAQVQTYFVNQWRPNENLSAPLSYRLQLSSSGEVVSFTALTEGGGAYRDRLIPNDTVSFPPSNSAALANGLTLKINLAPNGQVQIEKL